MFYSMMSESTANSMMSDPNSPTTNINLNRTSSSDHNANSTGLNNTTILDTSGGDDNSNSSSSNTHDSSKFSANDLDTDRAQFKLRQRIRQTIDELKNDVIVVNNKSKSNLFQTFKIKFRMLTMTVLHTDPTTSSSSSSLDSNKSQTSTSSKFLLKNTIVDRMKLIADNYFDLVSTIETAASFGGANANANASNSGSSSNIIEKAIILKYHQACAFSDHFLILLKPVNLNLVQKINQHVHDQSSTSSSHHHHHGQQPKYSLNDVQISVGGLQFNEYLINERITRLKQSSHNNNNSHR